jgi:phosphoribosylformylglycinamidine cyclo-ligase
VPSKHYKRAGVDNTTSDSLVEWISTAVRSAPTAGVVAGVGGFAGLYELPGSNGAQLLVGCTDGVGTKLKLAFQMKRHDTVGIDLVAMSVNDLITCGARPLFFLDYLAVGKLSGDVARQVVAGVIEGCRQSNCALLGGETAQLPDFYQKGEYDLAGFAVGIVDRADLVDGSKMKPGDVLVGLPSSGVHSNGYSLVRSILADSKKKLSAKVKGLPGTLGATLLEPTIIYEKQLRPLLSNPDLRGVVHAIAHITGSGIPGNLPRNFPAGCAARVDRSAWKPPVIFDLLAEWGGLDRNEMFEVFNMGMGMILVVEKARLDECCATLGAGVKVIGEIVEGRQDVTWA